MADYQITFFSKNLYASPILCTHCTAVYNIHVPGYVDVCDVRIAGTAVYNIHVPGYVDV